MDSLLKKKKFIIPAISAALILLLAATAYILYMTVGHSFNKYDPPPYDISLFDKNTVLTETQVMQDKEELINRVEQTHPYFEIKEVAGYEDAKRRFKDAAIFTAGDFYFAAAEYLAVFNDLHTSAVAAFSDWLYMDLSGYVYNDKVMMYPYGKDNTAFELIAVNGVPYKDIFIKYTSLENPNSLVRGIDRIFGADFLARAGIEWENSLTFTYKDADGSLFDVAHDITERPDDADSENIKSNFEAEIIDGAVLYIYARSMEDDGSYGDCIASIKEAVTSGIKKAVIDVTGNNGGSDGLGLGILDALGFEYSNMGMIMRYSEATARYRGTWRNSGFKTTRQYKYRSGNKNGIDLKVFCDEATASAAISGVAAICRYSDLGEIIGRMPGQNANFCGNMMAFQLTHSKVAYILPITYSYFEYAGAKAPDQLTVDIEVPPQADFLDYVSW
jgi:hypothetical protein